MSFLTEEEIGSFRIENMILHIVGNEEFRFEPARNVEHEAFFLERILDTDIAAVHQFEDNSITRDKLENIAKSEQPFEDIAQQLSEDFSRQHGKTSREGAFFIFQMSVDDPQTKIFSLIKYDYNEAIEQTNNDEGTLLRRIVNAFIADKKAIQKSALVRVVNGSATADVAAKDRAKVAPDITDYFATFLGTKRNRSDKELSQQVADAVRETLTSNRDILPNQDAARAFRITSANLRDRRQVNENNVIEAIWASMGENPEQASLERMASKTRKKLRARKLTGLSFPPDKRIFRKPPLRRLKTTEGVTVMYPDSADGNVVSRISNEGGGETITIRTEHVTDDDIIADKSR